MIVGTVMESGVEGVREILVELKHDDEEIHLSQRLKNIDSFGGEIRIAVADSIDLIRELIRYHNQFYEGGWPYIADIVYCEGPDDLPADVEAVSE